MLRHKLASFLPRRFLGTLHWRSFKLHRAPPGTSSSASRLFHWTRKVSQWLSCCIWNNALGLCFHNRFLFKRIQNPLNQFVLRYFWHSCHILILMIFYNIRLIYLCFMRIQLIYQSCSLKTTKIQFIIPFCLFAWYL